MKVYKLKICKSEFCEDFLVKLAHIDNVICMYSLVKI